MQWSWAGEDAGAADLILLRESPSASNSQIQLETERERETAFITTDELCLTHTHGNVCVCV